MTQPKEGIFCFLCNESILTEDDLVVYNQEEEIFICSSCHNSIVSRIYEEPNVY